MRRRLRCNASNPLMFRRTTEEFTMTSLQTERVMMTGTTRQRPLRPWPVLMPVDRAPDPKPLVMGGTLPPTPMARVRTHWQPSAQPMFPIEPANDPVHRLDEDDRAGLTLLALVLCVTVAVALLGFGLQVIQ
jgi:hypothetical protein